MGVTCPIIRAAVTALSLSLVAAMPAVAHPGAQEGAGHYRWGEVTLPRSPR